MFRIISGIVFYTLIALHNTYGQDEATSLQRFSRAGMFLFNKQYKEAATIYKQLLEADTTNKLLNFHLGLCYANMPERTIESIRFLRKSFGENPATTNSAPTTGLIIYMGKNSTVEVETQQYKPSDSIKTNRGFMLSPDMPYANICLSDDGQRMVFIDTKDSRNRVLFTTQSNGIWKEPTDISKQIGADGDCFPSSISNDGKRIYFGKYDNFESDIYVSTFNGKAWTTVKKLNNNINSKSWDAHATESSDGSILYFSSNRPEGFGGMDIYFSLKPSGGDWNKAINAGARINTRLNEDFPITINRSNTLIFCSQGMDNGKGYDIYFCHALGSNLWSEPIDIGYPVNTEEDDLNYVPLSYASRSFFLLTYGLKNGKAIRDNQYQVNMLSIRGKVNYLPASTEPMKGTIVLMNTADSQKNREIEQDPAGNYNFLTREGEYKLQFSTPGYKDVIHNLIVPYINTNDTVFINIDVNLK